MNVMFDRTIPGSPTTRLPTGKDRRGMTHPLSVAIVNNMPDSALTATQRQFTGLVMTATQGTAIIRLYHLPAIPRGDKARRYLDANAEGIESLYRTRPDALIVTGNEPKAARLDDEPYWPDLTRLVDWAAANTRTTLWSCLAAHAAVLHLDGIERRRLPQKKSGVLACQVSPAGRAAGLPDMLSTCHSRMNAVDADQLLLRNYQILSSAADGSVDVFARTFGSRFVFLQGHPEYEPDSLMREYRRDVGRYLHGERETYPEIPENYFENETVIRMENFRTEAERLRHPDLASHFPETGIRAGLADRLAASAEAVFAAWTGALQEASLPA